MTTVLTDVVKETSGLLDRRFLLNALLPTLIALGSFGGVVVGTLTDPTAVLRWWGTLDGAVRGLLGTGVVVVAVLLAALVSGRAVSVIRCYEGMWPRWSAWLLAPGRSWHRRVAHGADYPPDPDDVMPTRLGNILCAAEVYPRDRYSLDAVLTWPRLYPLLPDRLVASLSAARSEIEFHVTISALAGGFAVASGVWLVVVDGPAWLLLAAYGGGWVMALSAYRGALGPTRRYAEQVRVAFDLYRTTLLKHLELDGDERTAWQGLNQLWHRNIPLTTPLADEPEPEPTRRRRIPPIPTRPVLWLFVITTGLLAIRSV